MNIKTIENKVNNLLHKVTLKGAFPSSLSLVLPLVPIVEYLNYTIKVFSPNVEVSHISGAILQDKKVILINSKDNYKKQRFTVAHEIGHLLLHPKERFISCHKTIDKYNMKEYKKECEANEFAGCLLMPKKEFFKQWEECAEDIAKLSNTFLVSIPAVGLRISSLGLDD